MTNEEMIKQSEKVRELLGDLPSGTIVIVLGETPVKETPAVCIPDTRPHFWRNGDGPINCPEVRAVCKRLEDLETPRQWLQVFAETLQNLIGLVRVETFADLVYFLNLHTNDRTTQRGYAMHHTAIYDFLDVLDDNDLITPEHLQALIVNPRNTPANKRRLSK